MKAVLIKRPDTLWAPSGEEAEEVCQKFRTGFEFVAQINQKRIGSNHRRAMASLRVLFHCQRTYEDENVFRKALTLDAGYFSTLIRLDGSVVLIPDSISYDAMEEPVFKEWKNKVIQVFIDRFGPQLDHDTLEHIVRL